MSFLGSVNFYTKLFEKDHINLKLFYDLLHESTPWNWTDDREHLGIAHDLQIYDFLIIGSPHPKQIFTDNKSLIPSFTEQAI